jgi:hypothetical protein
MTPPTTLAVAELQPKAAVLPDIQALQILRDQPYPEPLPERGAFSHE